MTKEEIRAKYARIPTDFSQIEMLKNQLLDAGLLEVAQINPENAGKSIIFDENGALSVGEGGPTIDGNSLVIPEQPAPEPVITIDGVDYYHKQEFDLEEIAARTPRICFNVLTKDETEITGDSRPIFPSLYLTSFGPGKAIQFLLYYGPSYYCLYDPLGYDRENYTSRAFTVVDTQEEVTDNTKICLPTCSAYYGFLSEDGKTFISYYNLKSESASEYVNSIKQGNAVISLKDSRIPDSAIADAGKVVKVADDGSYELGEAGGGLNVIQFGSFGSGWTDKTVSELYEAVNETDGVYIVSAIQYGAIQGLLVKITKSDSSFLVSIITTEGDNYTGSVSGSTTINTLVRIKLPPIPFDAASKTYVLKCVNGTLTWVE